MELEQKKEIIYREIMFEDLFIVICISKESTF